MTKCYICNRKASKLSKLSFHRFPSDEESKQKWLESIGKFEPAPVKRSTVCSLHFAEECFRYGLVYGMRRLKEGSIPTLFLNETPQQTEMLNRLHTTTVCQTLDEVVNQCRIDKFNNEDSSDESLESFEPTKLKSQTKINYKRKEIHGPKKRIRFNLSWEKVRSAPDGGKKYWELAQRELIARKKRIKTLEVTLRRTKHKLVNIQTTIKELKDNPYIAVYVQNDE